MRSCNIWAQSPLFAFSSMKCQHSLCYQLAAAHGAFTLFSQDVRCKGTLRLLLCCSDAPRTHFFCVCDVTKTHHNLSHKHYTQYKFCDLQKRTGYKHGEANIFSSSLNHLRALSCKHQSLQIPRAFRKSDQYLCIARHSVDCGLQVRVFILGAEMCETQQVWWAGVPLCSREFCSFSCCVLLHWQTSEATKKVEYWWQSPSCDPHTRNAFLKICANIFGKC